MPTKINTLSTHFDMYTFKSRLLLLSTSLFLVLYIAITSSVYAQNDCFLNPPPFVNNQGVIDGKLRLEVDNFDPYSQRTQWTDSRNPTVTHVVYHAYKDFTLVAGESSFTIDVVQDYWCDLDEDGNVDLNEFVSSRIRTYTVSCGVYPSIPANQIDHMPIKLGRTQLFVKPGYLGAYDGVRWYRIEQGTGIAIVEGEGNNLEVTIDPNNPQANVFEARALKDCGGGGLNESSGNSMTVDLSDAYVTNGVPYNYVEAISFDEFGDPLLHSRSYMDNNGSELQNLTKDPITGHVFATQTIRDEQGRSVFSPFSAPVSSTPPSAATAFDYRPDFIKASDGTTYNYTHFDNLSGNANPSTLSDEEGTAGWYFSDNSTLREDGGLHANDYPFSIMDHYDNGLGEVRRVAGSTSNFTLGSGHEVVNGVIPVSAELDHYLQVRAAILPGNNTPATLKNRASVQFKKDGNGNAGIVIQDSKQKVLMTAKHGNWIQDLVLEQVQVFPGALGVQKIPRMRVYSLDNTNQLEIVKAPSSSASSATLKYDNNSIGSISVNRTYANSNYVGVIDIEANDRITSRMKIDLGNISYRFYDDAGRLIATVPPLGVYALLQLTDLSSINDPYDLPYATIFEHDFEGRLLKTTEVDGGWVKYIYRRDGLLRFSQTSEQASRNAFSYLNVDAEDRVVASGEYVGTAFGFDEDSKPNGGSTLVSTILEEKGEIGGLNIAFEKEQDGYSNHHDWIRSVYDNYDSEELSLASSPFIQGLLTISQPVLEQGNIIREATKAVVLSDGFQYSAASGNSFEAKIVEGFYQSWTEGSIAYTESENSETWFSYQEDGKANWIIQRYKGLGWDKLHTINYTYDFYGNVKKVVYNQGQSDAFYHHYSYDNKQRMVKVETSRDGINTTEQASYSYYFHGPLRRMVLGENLQGIDYTYNATGGLKAVNNPLNPSLDPDFGVPSEGVDIPNDVFSFGFDYYDGDFTTSDNNGAVIVPGLAGANYSDQYSGLPNTVYWNTHSLPAGFSSPDSNKDGSPRGYTLNYDEQYQMLDGKFGWISLAGNTGTFTGTNKYRETLTYDAHGNILTLKRTDKNAGLMDDLTYIYTQGRNQLEIVLNEGVTSAVYAMDDTTYYTYNLQGQLIEELNSIYSRRIYYTSEGYVKKVEDVTNGAQNGKPVIEFFYNELGYRIKTQRYDQQGDASFATYYVYSFQGDLLTVYEQGTAESIPVQVEVPVYGIGRLGVVKVGTSNPVDQMWFALKDNIGNVRAVITKAAGLPLVLEMQDYYPFGRVNPWYTYGNEYRFGYQGEFSEELFDDDLDNDNTTGWNAFMLRMYDARIGRWVSVDPAGQYDSPYKAMGNNPLNGVDTDGAFFEELWNWLHGDGWVTNYALENMGDYSTAEAVGNNVTEVWTLHFNPMVQNYNATIDVALYASKHRDAIIFEDIIVIESKKMEEGGIALPPTRIIVAQGGLDDENLLNHEFGHILQYREFGFFSYYDDVALPSLTNAMLNKWFGIGIHHAYHPVEVDANRRAAENGYTAFANNALTEYPTSYTAMEKFEHEIRKQTTKGAAYAIATGRDLVEGSTHLRRFHETWYENLITR